MSTGPEEGKDQLALLRRSGHRDYWHAPMARIPMTDGPVRAKHARPQCMLLRSNDPYFHEPEVTHRARWQAKQDDELREGSLGTPRTAATEAYAAECRFLVQYNYPGLDLSATDDVLMFCPQREHPTRSCNFKTNDLRLLDEHFRQYPPHQAGRVALNRCKIRYQGEEPQPGAAERVVFIGPDPATLG